MLPQTGWRVRGQCDQGLAQLLQARPRARKTGVMAVHDSDMIRNKRCRNAEGTDVFGHDDPAVCYRGAQYLPVVGPAKSRSVRGQRNSVNAFSRKILSEPARVVLVKQEPDLIMLRWHREPAGVPRRPVPCPGWHGDG